MTSNDFAASLLCESATLSGCGALSLFELVILTVGSRAELRQVVILNVNVYGALSSYGLVTWNHSDVLSRFVSAIPNDANHIVP